MQIYSLLSIFFALPVAIFAVQNAHIAHLEQTAAGPGAGAGRRERTRQA
ncbi:hypothetical protein [Moorella sp. ACPs]